MSNKTGEETQPSEKTEEDTTLNEEEQTSDEQADGKKDVDKETLLAQKAHWRDKAQKAEEGQKELEAKLKEIQDKKTEKETPPTSDAEWKEKIDFITSNRQYSAKDVKYLTTIAKGSGRSLTEVAEDEDVKGYLEYQHKQVEADKTTPSSTNRTSVSEKYDLKNMSEEETKKAYPEIVEEILSKKNNQV